LRTPVRNAPSRRVATEGGGLALGLLGALEALSSHRLLDRLIRGRLWIGLVAFALIGIVTLQLGLLKLNSNIGRALERESALQRANAALSIEDSELSGGSRVESQAEGLGMRLTGVGGLQFHDSHARSDVPRAAAALASPSKPATESSAESPSSATSESQASAPSSGSEGSEVASEATSSSGESSATTTGASEEASSETHSGEAEASAPASAASEPSTEAGGGTAAPGG
jgi:cell division protein FtsL